MRATVEDVLEGNREDVGLLGASEVGDVSIKWDALMAISAML